MNLREMLSGNAAGSANSDSHEYATDASEAITLHFVTSEAELEVPPPGCSIVPPFTHQIFDNEKIFGYKGLQVDVYINAHTFFVLVEHSFESKIDDEDGLASSVALKADDVVAMIGEWMAEDGWTSERGTFIDNINASEGPSAGVHGVLKNEYTVDSEIFQTYASNMQSESHATFHGRMQTLVVWFIDGGCHLDLSDTNWEFMHTYRLKRVGDGYTYACVGYVSVYKLWSYPEHIRKRLSQMFIVPQDQRRGHGRRLLDALYADNMHMDKLRDITVEDPTDEFKFLRDVADGTRCKRLAEFSSKLSGETNVVKKAIDAAHCKLKMYKRQARRLYEVLWLQQIDMSDADVYKNYRLSVKQRLLCDCQETLGDLEGKAKIEKLSELYTQLEGEYRQVGERLRC